MNDTGKYQDLDQRHLWHPFTQMAAWLDSSPLVIESAEAEYLIDTDGNRYIDGVASLWCNVHGHRHPLIDQRIAQQLKKVAHTTMLGLTNVPAVELAEKLVAVTPEGLERVFYSDSGSEAVEIAVKMAYQYWQQKELNTQRTRFAALTHAYHGDTIGSVSIGGMDLFHRIFQDLLFEKISITAPNTYRCPWGAEGEASKQAAFDALERVLGEHHESLCALVMEPLIQGAAGMIMHPEGYLARARELCDQYNILLIVDEVATGFGRTGTMFACEQEGVRPDLMAMAKGLTGGYLPLAATMATEEIFQAFLGAESEQKTFFHGHTYTGNPLACAAALGSLDVFEGEDVIGRVNEIAGILAEELETWRKLPWTGDIRQRGVMAGVELVRDQAAKEPFDHGLQIGAKVCATARKHGVILRPLGDVLIFMPLFCISDENIRKMVHAARCGIEEVLGRP